MTGLWARLINRNFTDLSGAVLDGTIPIREALVNEVIGDRSGLRIRIHPENRVALTYQFPAEPSERPAPVQARGFGGFLRNTLTHYVTAAANALLSILTVNVTLNRTLDVDQLKLKFKVSALGTFAMIFAKSFGIDINEWISQCGEWFCLDLKRFEAVDRHRELVRHIQSVEFQTVEGTLFIDVRVHVQESGA
jgi:hypothetical protein